MWCVVGLSIALNSIIITALLIHCSKIKSGKNQGNGDNRKNRNEKRVEPSIRIKIEPIPLDAEDAEEMKSSSKSKKSDSQHEWEKRIKKIEEELQDEKKTHSATIASVATTQRSGSTASATLSLAPAAAKAKNANQVRSSRPSTIDQLLANKKQKLQTKKNEKKKFNTLKKLRSKISLKENIKKVEIGKQQNVSKMGKFNTIQSFVKKQKEKEITQKNATTGDKRKVQLKKIPSVQTVQQTNRQPQQQQQQRQTNGKANINEKSAAINAIKTARETRIEAIPREINKSNTNVLIKHQRVSSRRKSFQSYLVTSKNPKTTTNKQKQIKKYENKPQNRTRIKEHNEDIPQKLTHNSATIPPAVNVATLIASAKELELKTAPTPVSTPIPKNNSKRIGSQRLSQQTTNENFGMRLKRAIVDITKTDDSSSSFATMGRDEETTSIDENSNYYISRLFH